MRQRSSFEEQLSRTTIADIAAPARKAAELGNARVALSRARQ
jgi:hypothetical protein